MANLVNWNKIMRGYGKIILFGEHAVVYGYPALAVNISKGICAQIETTQHEEDYLCVPNWNFNSLQQQENSLSLVFHKLLQQFPESSKKFKVSLHSEIPCGCGLGSSAATCVAIVRVLDHWHNTRYPLDKINELAYIGEQIFHGTPSGLDNTVACFGGICYLRDPGRFPVIESATAELPIGKLSACLLPPLQNDVKFVIIDTARERETQKMVGKVKNLLEQNRPYYTEIMEKIGDLSQHGWQALCDNDSAKLGELLNENQEYLRELQVSCPEIDEICEKSLKAGALGAKLTGAGGGGCVIAYAPDCEMDIVELCDSLGFKSFVASIGCVAE